jgi:2-keto-3-deoxy-galactonokinase
MLANAECDDRAKSRSAGVLLGQLLIGLRDRATIEQNEISLNGRQALHRVLDGRVAADGAPTRIEAYVVTEQGCVYDFAYAAPPASFEAWRADFRRFVESFAKERAD